MAQNNDLSSTVDAETDLEALRNGGPTTTPGVQTTTGGTAGPASVAEAKRRLTAPATGERDAEDAHGGSMAPGAVDATGHRIAQPPPTDATASGTG